MRISRFALCLFLIALAPALAVAGTTPFNSAQEALRQGMSAYNGGYYEIAIPALEYAAAEDEFMAEYYLARIYADNSGSHTDHAKAYMLFQRIADQHIDADPDEDPRAPYVGKSLTALAGYVRVGLPEIGLNADPERAVFYLNNASTTFNDEDAQFELAKLQLKGEGVETNVPLGKHWLSILSQNGHAGAQAFLADLLWRGKFMEADRARALALITIAVENAPQNERLWIEDIYQNIFCGAAEGTRKQATGIVAQWGNRYGRNPDNRDRSDLGQLAGGPVRTCQNGEPVGPIPVSGENADPEKRPVNAGTLPRPPDGRSLSYGSAVGRAVPGLRDVGTSMAPTTGR
jgi:hypothetical protein